MPFSNRVALPENTPRYKGNLHAHSTVSDGHLSPAEVVADFRAHGYLYVYLLSTTALRTSLANSMTGSSSSCRGSRRPPCSTMTSTPATVEGAPHARHFGHRRHGRSGAPEHFSHGEYLHPIERFGTWDGLAVAQQLGDYLAAHGCAVAYNHPIWSRIDPADVIGLKGIFGIEVYNYDTENEGGDGADTVYWDLMLRRGQRVGGIAADDSHHVAEFDDVFEAGSWCALPSLRAMRSCAPSWRGEYYSSAGPEVRSWGVRNGRVWIDCSPCERVTLVAGRTHRRQPHDHRACGASCWSARSLPCAAARPMCAWSAPMPAVVALGPTHCSQTCHNRSVLLYRKARKELP